MHEVDFSSNTSEQKKVKLLFMNRYYSNALIFLLILVGNCFFYGVDAIDADGTVLPNLNGKGNNKSLLKK